MFYVGIVMPQVTTEGVFHLCIHIDILIQKTYAKIDR